MQTTQATPNGAGLVQHVTGTSPTHIIRHKHKRSRARNPPVCTPISPAPGPTLTSTTPMDRGSLEQKAAADPNTISIEPLVGLSHLRPSAAADSPHINHRGHQATQAMKCPNGDYKLDEP